MADYQIDPPDKRYTTVHGRYQLSAESEGFIETCQTKVDAFRRAYALATARGYAISIYDVMARRGEGQLWEVAPSSGLGAVGLAHAAPPKRRRAP